MPPTVVTVPEVPRRWKFSAPAGGACLQGNGNEAARHLVDHVLEDIRRDPLSTVALGERHDPDREGVPGPDTLARA
jgi:hypothetical protein